jgi:hypothetical protein
MYSRLTRGIAAIAPASWVILRSVHVLQLPVRGRALELVWRECARRIVSLSHSHDHSASYQHGAPMRPIAELRWLEMGWIFCDGRRVAVERRGDVTRVRDLTSQW